MPPKAFKPPRQVNAPATSTASSSKATTTSQAKRGGKAKKAAPVATGKKSAQKVIISSSENEDNSDAMEDELSEDEGGRAAARKPPAAAEVEEVLSQDEVSRPTIPPKLLARLLHSGFEDSNMKIGKEAMAVVGKYMETFVREALARAAYERDEAEREGGISDGFLQVEDLEKLAPQLLLDF